MARQPNRGLASSSSGFRIEPGTVGQRTHMTPMSRVAALILALSGTLSSCASDEADPRDGSDSAPPAAGATSDPARDPELVEAAERVVRFLQGELSFSELRVADTVTLRLSPEGSGAQASLPRESLHDRANWVVPTHYGHQSLVPPLALPHLTARSGVHFNCLEYQLASLAPDLARLPHVGIRLAPADNANCLQTWNVTLVFEAIDGQPVLVGALYDQWEW
jgi:hypothetical protein